MSIAFRDPRLHESWIGRWSQPFWLPRLRSPAQSRIWGDGLCDESLETTLYPARWNEVCDDELVFLLPSLTQRSQHGTARETSAARLAPYISQHIHAHLEFSLDRLATCPELVRRSLSPSRVVVASGVLSASLGDVVAAGQPERVFVGTRRRPACTRAEALVHLALLAELDRSYQDVIAPTVHPSHAGPVRPLEQVALVSMAARINGAYVYEAHSGHHEILTAFAWLGHLLTAPSAYLPVIVAETLIDLLDHARQERDPCLALLGWCAEQAGGRSGLVAVARRVVRSGRPALMRRHSGRSRVALPPLWNADLFDQLDGLFDDARAGGRCVLTS